MKVRNPSSTLALAIGGLALAIATTGTAVATAGSLVNITDPVTPAKARVNAKGQLKVDTGPVQPARGTATLTAPIDQYDVVIPPTTATLALTDLTWAVESFDTNAWTNELFQIDIAPAQDCANPANWSGFHSLGSRTVQPAASLVENFTTPLVLAPSAGTPWCLVSASVTASSYSATVAWTGNVLAGTLSTTSAPTGVPRLVNGRPAPNKTGPTVMVYSAS